MKWSLLSTPNYFCGSFGEKEDVLFPVKSLRKSDFREAEGLSSFSGRCGDSCLEEDVGYADEKTRLTALRMTRFSLSHSKMRGRSQNRCRSTLQYQQFIKFLVLGSLVRVCGRLRSGIMERSLSGPQQVLKSRSNPSFA